MKNNRVVYTCITGSYDKIREFKKSNGIDFICFCDEKSYELNKKNKSWQIKKIYDSSLNSKQLNRLYKINPHLFLKDYKESLYVDGNIIIKSDLNSFFDIISASNYSVGIYSHPDRNCAYKELIKLSEVGLLSGKYALEWFNFFENNKLSANSGFFECNIILRKHNVKSCQTFMKSWYELFEKWPERDQPSFAFAANINKHQIYDLGQAKLRSGSNQFFDITQHEKRNARFPRLIRRIKSETKGTLQQMRDRI